MPAALRLRTYEASVVSDAVPRRLAHAGLDAMRIQSIYRSVVNITTSDGLLCVASPDVGGLPNGIQVDLGADSRVIGLEPGMVVQAGRTRLRVPAADLEIRLDSAARWSARFRSPRGSRVSGAAGWRARASATRTIAGARMSTGGFGPLLREDATDGDRTGTLAVARPIVVALVAALEADDRSAAADIAIGLIGLGPGLTPSGDDALVGMEAGLHALGAPTAGFLASAVDGLEDRTTALAATLLRHAAAGEFAERLHRLVGALLGSDDETVATAIDRAASWGATSGMDSLFGVLIGLDLASRDPMAQH